MALDPRDDQTIEIFAQVCREMQAEMLQGVRWRGSHTEEFSRRATTKLAELAELGDLEPLPRLELSADSVALTRIANALERIAANLEKGGA